MFKDTVQDNVKDISKDSKMFYDKIVVISCFILVKMITTFVLSRIIAFMEIKV